MLGLRCFQAFVDGFARPHGQKRIREPWRPLPTWIRLMQTRLDGTSHVINLGPFFVA